jgi:hypothetical protein
MGGRDGQKVADIDEQHMAAGAAGYESVRASDTLAKVAELHESGVVEGLDLDKRYRMAAGKHIYKSRNAPQYRTRWIQTGARADASQ